MLNCGQINCPGGDSNASDPQPKTMAVLPAFGPWKLVELFWLLIKRCSYALLVYCLCFWKPLHCYTSLKTPGQQINRPDLSCSIYSCIYTLDMFCLSVIPCNQTVSCNWPKWFRELPFFLIISTIFFARLFMVINQQWFTYCFGGHLFLPVLVMIIARAKGRCGKWSKYR